MKSPQKSDMGKTPFLGYRFAQLYLFPGSIGPEIFYLEIASVIYHSKAFFYAGLNLIKNYGLKSSS